MTLDAVAQGDSVVLTKAKLADLGAYLAGVQGWMTAAVGCLEAVNAVP